jgi:3-dehydroquinate dehydratase-2
VTASPRRLLLVNGPNLNLLGTREPEVYGRATLDDVVELVERTADELGYGVSAVQSNHEGVLIDAIHDAREDCAGVVINPGGLTHTSVSLRDALTGVALPFAEVHVSDVHAREPFRHFSYLSDVAALTVVGEGIDGYARAVRELVAVLDGAAG